MVNLPERLLNGGTEALLLSPILGVCGYLGGFVYAKLSDLPPSKVAPNWAIYAAASNAIRNIALSFFDHERVNAFIHATVIGSTGAYFIYEMRRLELMGDKMAIFMAAIHTLAVLTLLGQALQAEEIVN